MVDKLVDQKQLNWVVLEPDGEGMLEQVEEYKMISLLTPLRISGL